MARQGEIARATKPVLMLMDKPSLGLALLFVNGICDIINKIHKQGVKILLDEQNANLAMYAADFGYVLETGNITICGTGAELLENVAVKAAYLEKNGSETF